MGLKLLDTDADCDDRHEKEGGFSPLQIGGIRGDEVPLKYYQIVYVRTIW